MITVKYNGDLAKFSGSLIINKILLDDTEHEYKLIWEPRTKLLRVSIRLEEVLDVSEITIWAIYQDDSEKVMTISDSGTTIKLVSGHNMINIDMSLSPIDLVESSKLPTQDDLIREVYGGIPGQNLLVSSESDDEVTRKSFYRALFEATEDEGEGISYLDKTGKLVTGAYIEKIWTSLELMCHGSEDGNVYGLVYDFYKEFPEYSWNPGGWYINIIAKKTYDEYLIVSGKPVKKLSEGLVDYIPCFDTTSGVELSKRDGNYSIPGSELENGVFYYTEVGSESRSNIHSAFVTGKLKTRTITEDLEYGEDAVLESTLSLYQMENKRFDIVDKVGNIFKEDGNDLYLMSYQSGSTASFKVRVVSDNIASVVLRLDHIGSDDIDWNRYFSWSKTDWVREADLGDNVYSCTVTMETNLENMTTQWFPLDSNNESKKVLLRLSGYAGEKYDFYMVQRFYNNLNLDIYQRLENNSWDKIDTTKTLIFTRVSENEDFQYNIIPIVAVANPNLSQSDNSIFELELPEHVKLLVKGGEDWREVESDEKCVVLPNTASLDDSSIKIYGLGLDINSEDDLDDFGGDAIFTRKANYSEEISDWEKEINSGSSDPTIISLGAQGAEPRLNVSEEEVIIDSRGVYSITVSTNRSFTIRFEEDPDEAAKEDENKIVSEIKFFPEGYVNGTDIVADSLVAEGKSLPIKFGNYKFAVPWVENNQIGEKYLHGNLIITSIPREGDEETLTKEIPVYQSKSEKAWVDVDVISPKSLPNKPGAKTYTLDFIFMNPGSTVNIEYRDPYSHRVFVQTAYGEPLPFLEVVTKTSIFNSDIGYVLDRYELKSLKSNLDTSFPVSALGAFIVNDYYKIVGDDSSRDTYRLCFYNKINYSSQIKFSLENDKSYFGNVPFEIDLNPVAGQDFSPFYEVNNLRNYSAKIDVYAKRKFKIGSQLYIVPSGIKYGDKTFIYRDPGLVLAETTNWTDISGSEYSYKKTFTVRLSANQQLTTNSLYSLLGNIMFSTEIDSFAETTSNHLSEILSVNYDYDIDEEIVDEYSNKIIEDNTTGQAELNNMLGVLTNNAQVGVPSRLPSGSRNDLPTNISPDIIPIKGGTITITTDNYTDVTEGSVVPPDGRLDKVDFTNIYDSVGDYTEIQGNDKISYVITNTGTYDPYWQFTVRVPGRERSGKIELDKRCLSSYSGNDKEEYLWASNRYLTGILYAEQYDYTASSIEINNNIVNMFRKGLDKILICSDSDSYYIGSSYEYPKSVARKVSGYLGMSEENKIVFESIPSSTEYIFISCGLYDLRSGKIDINSRTLSEYYISSSYGNFDVDHTKEAGNSLIYDGSEDVLGKYNVRLRIGANKSEENVIKTYTIDTSSSNETGDYPIKLVIEIHQQALVRRAELDASVLDEVNSILYSLDNSSISSPFSGFLPFSSDGKCLCSTTNTSTDGMFYILTDLSRDNFEIRCDLLENLEIVEFEEVSGNNDGLKNRAKIKAKLLPNVSNLVWGRNSIRGVNSNIEVVNKLKDSAIATFQVFQGYLTLRLRESTDNDWRDKEGGYRFIWGTNRGYYWNAYIQNHDEYGDPSGPYNVPSESYNNPPGNRKQFLIKPVQREILVEKMLTAMKDAHDDKIIYDYISDPDPEKEDININGTIHTSLVNGTAELSDYFKVGAAEVSYASESDLPPIEDVLKLPSGHLSSQWVVVYVESLSGSIDSGFIFLETQYSVTEEDYYSSEFKFYSVLNSLRFKTDSGSTDFPYDFRYITFYLNKLGE